MRGKNVSYVVVSTYTWGSLSEGDSSRRARPMCILEKGESVGKGWKNWEETHGMTKTTRARVGRKMSMKDLFLLTNQVQSCGLVERGSH